jgi:SCP-2 sterol transfer family
MASGRKSGPKPKPGSDPLPADSGTSSFFEELQQRGHEPILKGETGTMRFDLYRGSGLERWFVTVADGNVTVSHSRGRADTVTAVDGELFDLIARGEANALTAQLRGALVVDGDQHLLMVFQRLFPGPPRASTGTRPAKEPTRRAGR